MARSTIPNTFPNKIVLFTATFALNTTELNITKVLLDFFLDNTLILTYYEILQTGYQVDVF